jgi:hypothetical protein
LQLLKRNFAGRRFFGLTLALTEGEIAMLPIGARGRRVIRADKKQSGDHRITAIAFSLFQFR